ncbi:MAG: class I SAM-dependent RNA methyltransferase [Sphaerochaetaceae bacterium]|nr:class I SAM-dependent RNA methyltransferase [Spirochaetales bacterium]MDY5499487.1 class I SAM-dependent RNA methyltransferase [Sphaerochaetaceae bacterium]
MIVRTESLVQGGLALAKDPEGKILLVDGALSGETVDAQVDRTTASVSFAHVTNILSANPDRVFPACPVYQACGGCNLQHLASDKQAEVKDALVKENLRRIANVKDIPSDPVASGPAWGWRIRCRFHVDLVHGKVGFLASKSNQLVALDDCPVLVDSLRNLLQEKKQLLVEGRKAMFRGKGTRGFFEVACFAGDDGVSFDEKPVHVSVAGVDFLVSGKVFFQSNREVLPAMASFIRRWGEGDRIVDLYSGVGTLSAFLGERDHVALVEKNPSCRALASRNVPWGKAFTGDAGRFKARGPIDLVLVDPPRLGLDKGVPSLIASWKPRRILYMSCNSVTLARDVARFLQVGYAPRRLAVFDMYPQTWEQEACVVLDRKE